MRLRIASTTPPRVAQVIRQVFDRAHNTYMTSTRFGTQYSGQSFGDLSRFLREGVADEESRELRESLGLLSQLIDEAVKMRRVGTDPQGILVCVGTLARSLRDHQLLLTGLGSAWHALYEFGAYQRALRELGTAIADWHRTLERRTAKERASFDQFELLAWRTLGEALLLIDMYEHQSNPHSDLQASTPARKMSSFQKLRGWLRSFKR